MSYLRVYYPRFALHEAHDNDRKWLAKHNLHPMPAEDITDMCATLGVSAHLYDRADCSGRCIALVDARGEVDLYDDE